MFGSMLSILCAHGSIERGVGARLCNGPRLAASGGSRWGASLSNETLVFLLAGGVALVLLGMTFDRQLRKAWRNLRRLIERARR